MDSALSQNIVTAIQAECLGDCARGSDDRLSSLRRSHLLQQLQSMTAKTKGIRFPKQKNKEDVGAAQTVAEALFAAICSSSKGMRRLPQ
jgi:hypothetical protein